MRRPVLLALLIALAPLAVFGPAAPPPPVRATPIPLDRSDPARTRAGAFVFTGGWVLSSRDRRFGGLSALVPLGRDRLLAVSDSAQPVMIALGGAAPVVRVLPTLDVGANPRSGKSGYDTESMARDPVTGRIWMGLERRNVILRLRPDLSLDRRRYPEAMRDWPANGGAEAMALLPDGRLMVIAETVAPRPGTRTMLIFPVDPASRRVVSPAILAYRPPPGYDPSDAAALPDGRVLVLNRRIGLNGFSAIVTIIDVSRARAEQVVTGIPVASLARPMAADNFEGIAVVPEGDVLTVYLISDDNFLPAQRTLLLRFRFDPRRLPRGV